jgi:hypothetical protein
MPTLLAVSVDQAIIRDPVVLDVAAVVPSTLSDPVVVWVRLEVPVTLSEPRVAAPVTPRVPPNEPSPPALMAPPPIPTFSDVFVLVPMRMVPVVVDVDTTVPSSAAPRALMDAPTPSPPDIVTAPVDVDVESVVSSTVTSAPTVRDLAIPTPPSVIIDPTDVVVLGVSVLEFTSTVLPMCRLWPMAAPPFTTSAPDARSVESAEDDM